VDIGFWIAVWLYVASLVHHTIAARRMNQGRRAARFALRCNVAFLDLLRARNDIADIADLVDRGDEDEALHARMEAEENYLMAVDEAFEQDA